MGRAPRKLVEARFRKEIGDKVKNELLLNSLTQVNEDEVEGQGRIWLFPWYASANEWRGTPGLWPPPEFAPPSQPAVEALPRFLPLARTCFNVGDAPRALA